MLLHSRRLRVPSLKPHQEERRLVMPRAAFVFVLVSSSFISTGGNNGAEEEKPTRKEREQAKAPLGRESLLPATKKKSPVLVRSHWSTRSFVWKVRSRRCPTNLRLSSKVCSHRWNVSRFQIFDAVQHASFTYFKSKFYLIIIHEFSCILF